MYPFLDQSGSSVEAPDPPELKEIFLAGTNYGANLGNIRVRSIGGSGGFRFTFKAPVDLVTVDSIVLIGIPTAGAAGAGKDIDLSSDYGALGEASNFHSESDTTTLYDLTGTSGQWTAVLDLTVVLSQLAADDYVGIFVDHNGIGGAIRYAGIRLRYFNA